MTLFKSILSAFLLQSCLIADAQDTTGLKLVSYDTLQLSLTASKVLVLKTERVSFVMDYAKAKELLTSQAKYGLLKELAKRQLDSIGKQIKNNDTAYLDNAIFTKWNWVPFDQLLCQLLNSRTCIIKDGRGTLHYRIIRLHGYIWPGKYIQWTGWRYFLPKAFEYFFECTESES